jgi:tRNA-dihydrouridine synthase
LPPYAVAGIDLNFGCPMAKICKKGVGGGLLDEPETMDAILAEMSQEIEFPLSVKIRIGVEDASKFEQIIGVLAKYNLNFVTVHARTVRGLYSEKVNFDYVKLAKDALKCKVIANGDINSAEQALAVVELTHCSGVMIGRAAVRNPFIFRQISELRTAGSCFTPTFNDLYFYILRLVDIAEKRTSSEQKQVGGLKKYLNFIGQCVDKNGEFLHHIRHATGKREIMEAADLCLKRHGGEHLCGRT